MRALRNRYLTLDFCCENMEGFEGNINAVSVSSSGVNLPSDNLPDAPLPQVSLPVASINTNKKRNRKKEIERLTFLEKVKILELLDLGVSQRKIAKLYNRKQTSISYLKAHKESILKQKEILEKGKMDLTRKRFSRVIESKLEKKVSLPVASINTNKKKNRKKEIERLTFLEKVKILELLDSGVSQTEIAKMYNRKQPSISYIKTHKESILKQKEILEKENMDLTRKRFSEVIESKLDKKLYFWFIQTREAGIRVTGKLLQRTAVIFNKMFKGPANFTASNGYLQSFQKRHGLRNLSVQGETLSDAAEFKETFCKYIYDFGYERDQIYNADESGLLWKLLPGNTLVTRDCKKVPSWKLAKDRVTIMVCANASGTHRIPLLMIGKYKRPRCLNGLNINALPVVYYNQKNALMDKELFIRWYKEVFLPAVTAQHKDTGKKCILILDNAPSHPPEQVLNAISDVCSVVYLPSNVTTSLIQPMNQGIIEKLKRLYRKNLLRDLLFSGCTNMKEFMHEMDLYKCIICTSDAWNSLTVNYLRNAWRKVISTENIESDSKDIEEITNIMSQIRELYNINAEETESWIHYDDCYSDWEVQSHEQIVFGTDSNFEEEEENDEDDMDEEVNDEDDMDEEVNDEDDMDEEVNDEDDMDEEVNDEDDMDEKVNDEDDMDEKVTQSVIPNSLEALKACKILQKWVYSRWDFTPQQLSVMNFIRQVVNDEALNNYKS